MVSRFPGPGSQRKPANGDLQTAEYNPEVIHRRIGETQKAIRDEFQMLSASQT
jgi:hypothetical protein